LSLVQTITLLQNHLNHIPGLASRLNFSRRRPRLKGSRPKPRPRLWASDQYQYFTNRTSRHLETKSKVKVRRGHDFGIATLLESEARWH